MRQTAVDGATLRARRAVAALFTVHGVVSGSFATRIPSIRDHLGLSPGWLGLSLVCVTVGAVVAMPLAARLAYRLGPRRSLCWLSVLCSAGLALPALAPALGWLCLLLFVYGCGLGLMDVAMNAHGVIVEERMGRSVMSGLHGMWSVGALIGGGAGALAVETGVDARLHLALTAPVLAALALLACRWALDPRPEPEAGAAAAGAEEAPPAFALPGKGVLLIGGISFFAVFAEGASMDWSGIYLRDVTHAAPGLAASAYTAFVCTMAAVRLSGDAIVRWAGPVRTIRVGGVLAAAGGALVTFARTPAPAVAGYALIGVGIAVAVPLSFAAAGRAPAASQGQAIAGVATLAYASGLAAPAAVGWIAQLTSLSASFGLITVLLVGLVAGAGVLRTPPRAAAEKAGKGTEPGTDAEVAAVGEGAAGEVTVRDETFGR
jgi:fucose permease